MNLYFRLAFLRQIIWLAVAVCVFTVSAAILFQNSDISTGPVGWEKSFKITPFKIKSRNLSVASRGNFVIAVYQGTEGTEPGIYASVSFNAGQSFLPPVRIDYANTKIENNPYVAVSGNGTVTVMWHKLVEDESTNRIFYATSSDMGATWSKAQRLKLGYEMEMLPMIYYDNRGRLHLFFHAYSSGGFNLFHAKSRDNRIFDVTGPIIKLSAELRGAFFPSIALHGKEIHIVWQGKGAAFTDDLYYMKSSSYGSRWSSPRKITASRANDASPSILMKGDTLYVVYHNNEKRSWAVKMLRSKDRGASWVESPIQVSDTNADCFSPQVVFSRNKLIIVWYDLREKVPRVFSRRYSIDGETFEPEQKLSLSQAPAKNPECVISGNRAVVLWEENRRIVANYTDIHVDPPEVFSYTHPLNSWSRNSTARIRWKPPRDESGIVGYSAVANNSPDFRPSVQNVKPTITRQILPSLDDGVSYFHIRAIDGAGNFSRTVHYKILVSANPLPMPVVVSPTHPENKPIKINDPLFRWAVDDVERLKGFVYSVSRGTVRKPNTFISKFELRLKDLEPGGYFFNIAAVDKTDRLSPVSNYYFIVGRAEKIDLDRIKKYARGRGYRKARPVLKPGLRITVPFNNAQVFERDKFDALLVPENIGREQVTGYSVYVNTKELPVRERVNQKGPIVHIRELRDGSYVIGARARYYRVEKGRKVYYWTDPARISFNVRVPREITPFEYYARSIFEKLSRRAGIVTGIITCLIMSIIVLGFGTRLLFYFRLAQYRLRFLMRLR